MLINVLVLAHRKYIGSISCVLIKRCATSARRLAEPLMKPLKYSNLLLTITCLRLFFLHSPRVLSDDRNFMI